MRKHMFRATLTAMVLLLALALPAGAIPSGLRAVPNQQLHFRTGPNTAFTDLYVLPKSTPIVAIELEEGNDVTWVLCDFEYKGSRVRGYTGLKRMEISGGISWANHARLERRLVRDAEVFASPDLSSTVRAQLSSGATVTFLEFEGSYCFIEYRRGSQRERGYVLEDCFMVDQDEYLEDFPSNDGMTLYVVSASAPMYAGPGPDSALLFNIPYDACVSVPWDEGYSGDYMPIYYGGLRGYGYYRDFNDLRGLPWD